MTNRRWTCPIALVVAALVCFALPGAAREAGDLIPQGEIAALETKLAGTGESASSARRKLALKRVIREGDALLEGNPAAPNRFEVLGILFRGRQQLVQLDNSTTNREAFLATCGQLAAAPDQYAALRLDADLLLTQAESARQGADSHARADALRPLVERYRDTDVEAKAIRIAMLMALELGNTRLVNDLRKVVARRFPADMDLINFQREKLAGQVFGAPFVGRFEQADGTVFRLPMDGMGTTTALYFWSREDDGVEQLKGLAEAWKKVKAETGAAGRFRFISFNLDELPDAGEGILREAGLDWPALRLPGSREHPIYKTYVRNDPKLLTMTPTGYTAMVMSGTTRPRHGWERMFGSFLARAWTKTRYTSQLQSVFAGEFLVMDPAGPFDPAAPPEWKAVAGRDAATGGKLPRTAASIPEDELRAIQACFIDPPIRYRTPFDQVRANYEKADELCRQAIAAYPDAPDLWLVRNRRITALQGLWKLSGDPGHFAAAVAEARSAIDGPCPPGTDVVARLCLARQALRAADADPKAITREFIAAAGGTQASGPALVAASLLALDAGDRLLHDRYRRTFLDKHADEPAMWTATAFLLDRYHRYWLYHPPFTAGWTYGRRQGYFLAIGTPEDADRTLSIELETLDGDPVQVPEIPDGKWTVISFVPGAESNQWLRRYGTFISDRLTQDVHLISAVLDAEADPEAVRKVLGAQKKPDPFPTMLVPGGMRNPLVRKLGILHEEERPNLVILRPDGGIAVALSGLTMSAQSGNVVQHVIEWHDEKAVDEALARGDLAEAKRLAFTYAPVKQLPPPDAHKNWKPKPLSAPHLRSRGKVYMAMEDWEAAHADIHEAYLKVNSKAGHLSMRTEELEETEGLKARIEAGME